MCYSGICPYEIKRGNPEMIGECSLPFSAFDNGPPSDALCAEGNDTDDINDNDDEYRGERQVFVHDPLAFLKR